jgi:hypothetical protein
MCHFFSGGVCVAHLFSCPCCFCFVCLRSVLYAQCCQSLDFHSGLPHRFPLTFITHLVWQSDTYQYELNVSFFCQTRSKVFCIRCLGTHNALDHDKCLKYRHTRDRLFGLFYDILYITSIR